MEGPRIHVEADATQRRLYMGAEGGMENFYELGPDDVVQDGDLCCPVDGGFWRYVVDCVGMTVREASQYRFYRRKPEVKESLTTAAEDGFYYLQPKDVIQPGDHFAGRVFAADQWRTVDQIIGTVAGKWEGLKFRRKIEAEPATGNGSLQVAAEPSLLEAVDALIAAMDSQADIPDEEDQKLLDQAYEALVLAADVARGKA